MPVEWRGATWACRPREVPSVGYKQHRRPFAGEPDGNRRIPPAGGYVGDRVGRERQLGIGWRGFASRRRQLEEGSHGMTAIEPLGSQLLLRSARSSGCASYMFRKGSSAGSRASPSGPGDAFFSCSKQARVCSFWVVQFGLSAWSRASISFMAAIGPENGGPHSFVAGRTCYSAGS